MREWQRLMRSFGYAIAGIVYTVKTQRNMQIHAAVAAAVLVLGWWLAIPKRDVLLVFFSIFLVLAFETMNTAVEKCVDLIVGDRRHPVARIAKDVAAGAVLLVAILAVIVGVSVFAEPLWHWFVTGQRRLL